MSACDVSALVQQLEVSSRLEFLYRIVEDTQNTIRFLDTKAAFCVTLLSGMVAGVLELHRGEHTPLHHLLFVLFVIVVAFSLVLCLRVIFPVIKPPSASSPDAARPLPHFFIHHHGSHHWLRHSFSNSVSNVLSENHASYTTKVCGATDQDFITTMCDEVLMISLIRQIKSDRLHTTMFALLGSVVLFAALMLS